MKIKNYLNVLALLCVLTLLIGFAYDHESLITIDKISVHPDTLNTRIHLETKTPLKFPQTYYAPDAPSTIVVDFENIDTKINPPIFQEEVSVVEGIKIKTLASDKLRLLINLKERVPYRLFSDHQNTIIELNQIQRNQVKYVLESQTTQELEKRKKKSIFLENIDISVEKTSLNIMANLTGKPVSQVFALDNPKRLVVDLFDTHYSDSRFVYPIRKNGIENLRAAQFEVSNPYTITRIVFDLTEYPFYTLNTEKKGLTISFYKPQPSPTMPVSEPPVPKISKPTPPPKKPVPTLEKQQEKPPKEKLASAKPALQEQEEQQQTPPQKERQEKNEQQPQQQTNQFQPRTLAEPEEKYTGEIISLRFKDADLRDVVLYLGEFAGLNVVFDPEVRGTVTCDLQDVPWDQALDLILKINKMGKVIEGNVLRIAPMSILTREEEEQRKLVESKELAGPVLVKTFTLSYSKAKDVYELLRTKLSGRGEIIVDERTNTLIISDVKDRITLLEKLISVFDTATPQVSIEARIVEATSSFIRNLGIQWGFLGIADPFYGNQTSLQFPHKILVDGTIIPQGIVTKGIAGPLGGYAINLPAPAFTTAMGLSFGNVLDTFRLDMAITALETSGEGRIISCPKVTTQNNQEAEILQGRQIPVQTVANFTVTTRYVNAALELRATPQITAEGTIIMSIEIRNNAADFGNLVNGIPPIITQSALTTVMVTDGGTTVIGGIYRTEDSITRERVPFFHKIPILGNLFRSFARTKQNRELLIFITPRIIK